MRRRLIPWADLADDLVQEIFLAARDNLEQVRGDSPLRRWLLGIARHKVEDHHRVHFSRVCKGTVAAFLWLMNHSVLLGQWAKDLPGLERSLLNEVQALPEETANSPIIIFRHEEQESSEGFPFSEDRLMRDFE